MKNRVKRIHFIGIGGTGMCGIAEVLHNLGYQISGSDMVSSASTQHLQAIGVKVFQGHKLEHVQDVEVVVTSTAIQPDNPELISALSSNIPVIPRALMLSELMRFRRGIAVAGTHGKTTTTSMLASILDVGNFDPTYVIGGRLNSVATNAKLGKGEFIIVEADESDASFLYLTPLFSIVTNIDEDHMETYEFSMEKLHQAFIEFVHRLPFYGKAFLCIENENINCILPEIKKPYSTYGLTKEADIFATDITANGIQMQFIVNVKRVGELLQFPVTLNFPGQHSVLNALGAIGVALECGTEISAIQEGLMKFQGVGRRFQSYGEINLVGNKGSALVIDDYGHHPIEIRSTILAAKQAYPGKRLVLVFQPHRYTRTRDLFEDFIEVLQMADLVILTDVYAAGEKPIVAADSKTLTRSLRVQSNVEPIYQGDISKVAETLFNIAQDNDLILTMGAGSINKIASQLVALSQKNRG
ncbi:MAG: UDP-N-acetylmuramate--L-alanine ligase [Neisseriaceae bacterium]|nr:MAG: UDP-N-acetylmuramate--L-alanine ligase [Neisseriaceae bacterium]